MEGPVPQEQGLGGAGLPADLDAAAQRRLRPGFRELHEQLKPAFFEIAEHAVKKGARVMLEWPGGCLYWNDEDYSKFFKKYGFEFVDFDGFGVCVYHKFM